MAQKNLYCDQTNCGLEACVFTLQPSAKVKACREHIADLIANSSPIITIAAYDFITTAKDLSEYLARKDAAQKYQSYLMSLKKRCESNRKEAKSQLQLAKEATLKVVERCFLEIDLQVEQRFEKVQAELNVLSERLEKYASDRNYAFESTLLDSVHSGALFMIAHGDCALTLVKTLIEHYMLLPLDETIPGPDTWEKLLKQAKSLAKKEDLAESIRIYAEELGHSDPSCEFTTAANKLIRKTAKKLQAILPLTVTEEEQRYVAELFLQDGQEAREKGKYAKALKKLESGWDIMRKWEIRSPEMCLQLGSLFVYFGRTDEACEMLWRGLNSNPTTTQLYLQLSNCLVEVYHQTGEYSAAADVAESSLNKAGILQDTFELYRALYFLADSHNRLETMSKGYALVDYWISRTSAKSLQSECTLQLISAERNFKQGNEKRAAELYVEALRTLELLLPNAYLTAISQYRLGVVYKADLKSQKEAEKYYLKSICTHSAHFPHSISLASCLNNIANLHKDRSEYEAAETNYLKAIDICSAHFPQLLPHALCLYNLGTLLQMRKRKAEAVQILEVALDVYLHIGAHANAAECRSRLQELRE